MQNVSTKIMHLEIPPAKYISCDQKYTSANAVNMSSP